MAGEVLDWPASPETIDFPLDFLDPGRGAGAKSAPRTGSRFFVKKISSWTESKKHLLVKGRS